MGGEPGVKRERVQEEFHKWRKARALQGQESKCFYSVLPTAAWAERRHRLLRAQHSSAQPRGSRWIFRMFATQAAAFEFADSMNSEFDAHWRARVPCVPPGQGYHEGNGQSSLDEDSAAQDVPMVPERAEVFAFEKARMGEDGGGRRAYAVATYSSLWNVYSRPYLQEEEPLPAFGTRKPGETVPRNFYEVLREGMPAQLYFDLEYLYADGDNAEKQPALMLYWLKRLVCHGVMAHYGIPCSEQQVLDLYSPSESKFSMHLLVRLGHISSSALPGGHLELPIAFSSNIQCGRFVHMLLTHLVEGSAVPPHPRRADYMAGFLDLLRGAIAEADTDSPLLQLPNSVLMERLYHEDIGRDLLTFSVGACVRGTVTPTAAAAARRRQETASHDSPARDSDDFDEETLAHLLAVTEEQPDFDGAQAECPSRCEEVTMDFAEMRELFTVSTDKGSTWFVDTAVYTRNRNFRLLGSHKQGRFFSPLLLSPTSTYSLPLAPPLPQVKLESGNLQGPGGPVPGKGEVRHFESCLLASREAFSVAASKRNVGEHAEELCHVLFMHSLVCHEVYQAGNHRRSANRLRLRCPFRMLPGGATAWLEEDDEESSKSCCLTGGYSASGMAQSNFKEVDCFIGEVASAEGGGVRSWLHYTDTNSIVYNVSGMCCYNIGRPHKSNSTLLVVDLSLGTYYQRCLDPDCRAQGYRGLERRLPTAVLATIPGFEMAVARERLPTVPSLLYRQARPWEDDDRVLAQALIEDPSLCP